MKKKIPFHLMPGSWGLKGRTREIAEAEYYFEGSELEKKLVDITESDLLQAELLKLDIALRYDELTQVQHNTQKCAVLMQIIDRDMKDGDDKELAKLDLRLEYEEITATQHARAVADIKKEPYVNVVDIGVNPDGAATGYLELDWNDEFVAMLQENGYTGLDDNAIVNKWFNNVCRTILIQEQADLDYGMESADAPAGRTISKD